MSFDERIYLLSLSQTGRCEWDYLCVSVAVRGPVPPQPLCWEGYQERFTTLIHCLEVSMEEDIRQFDMQSVSVLLLPLFLLPLLLLLLPLLLLPFLR